MILRPLQPERGELPDKISALHIGGHALRAAAYGFGAFELAHLGLGSIPNPLVEIHNNFGQGLLDGAGDAAVIATSIYALAGSLKNFGVGALETYYNLTGGANSRLFRRTNDAEWV